MRTCRQRECWRVWRTLLLTAALTVASGKIAATSVAQSPPTLSPRTVPAEGRREAVLTASTFGRYAVTVTSKQGTALQLLDRIAGPGPIQGIAGTTDGRLDVFLDRGEHKIVTYAHDKGSGEATLAAHSFSERNGTPPPQLVELKPVDTSLDDFEKRSFWIEVKERRQVVLEAAGRNLADLRLWSNGEWLIDAEPRIEVITPEAGHPLLVCRLATMLDPGFYLLTAYGGPAQPWAETSPEHPLHLRLGIPQLGSVGRARHIISPFGIDRWVVPRSANYFRLELPETRTAALEVGSFEESHPFDADGSPIHIDKNSLVPVAEVDNRSSPANTKQLVTVTGSAGQTYLLQYFDSGEPYYNGGRYWNIRDEGTYWVSTVHAGDPSDSIDATGIIMRTPRGVAPDAHIQPFASQVVDLAKGQSWARRCNLLTPISLFFHIATAGKYEVVSRGIAAKFRIEPFFVNRPEHYEIPELRGGGGVWDLDPGYYVLTAEPEKKGLIDIAIRPASRSNAADVFAELIGKDRTAELRALRAAVQFSTLTVEHDYRYTLFLNEQRMPVGMILRHLPLDLTDPLPIIQKPGEEVAVPFTVAEPGSVRAEAEDGTPLAVSVDGGSALQSQTVKPGEHRASVRYDGDGQVRYDLLVEPLALQASTPLPPLPDLARAAPPKLRVLTEKEPQYLDLERRADATFLVRATTAALYRLQSTGLLTTEGRLRTRTITSFAQGTENGVSHNFFIGQYLREGDYQITVSTLGPSAGHLGVTLERTQLIDGGSLTPGVAAHLALPAGEAVRYTFTVPAEGDYRLRSIGVGTTFKCRIEDADGWPIEPSNILADVTHRFEPGTYHFVSLPEPVAGRRLTLLERIQAPAKLEGHGPHTLPLAQHLEHVWTEPAAGDERTPDTWEFALPAPVDARIDLSDEMQGTLVLVNDDLRLTPIATLPPARGWKGKLESGRYRLETVCARTDNQHAYAVAVWPEQLVSGLDRSINPPASVPLSVGRDGLVQLSSFGAADVRARLYDAQGRLVASNDDGPDDWNFQIQSRLQAGMYRLQVDPVALPSPKVLSAAPTPGSDQHDNGEPEGDSGGAVAEVEAATPAATPNAATASVSMRSPQETEAPPLEVPAQQPFTLTDAVQLYPLSLGEHDGLLLIGAQSSEGVGLAIEAAASASEWRTLASASGRRAHLEMPASNGSTHYRLRVWSLDGRAATGTIDAVTVDPSPLTEQQLANGVVTSPVAHLTPHTGVALVELDRPGLFRLDGDPSNTRICALVDAPCEVSSNGLVTSAGTRLWLVSDLSTPHKTAATRVLLPSVADEAVQFDVTAAHPALCDLVNPAGGPVLALVSSPSGQPGVALVERRNPSTATPDNQDMAVGTWSAAAVALKTAQPVAVVWSAGNHGEPIPVRLRQLSFAAPTHEPLPWGEWDSAVGGVSARAFDLPPGPKRLRLALQPNTVLVLSEGDRIASVHWEGDEPFEETVEGNADHMTILHTRSGDDHVHVDLLPLNVTDIAPSVALGAPYERSELRAGVLRLAVSAAPSAAAAPRTLHVRTANPQDGAAPTLISAAGRIARAIDLPLDDGAATVLVPHAPGLVLAWIDRRGEEAEDLWGHAALPVETTLGPPAVIPLTGMVQAMRFSPSEPLMLHVRTSTPVVTLLQRGAAPPDVEIHPNGTVLDAYLSEEPAQLGLRALGAGELTGTAEVTTSPVVPIREGLGPEVLLAAGATRLFSFNVTQAGPVGIGVHANPDVVDCTLLDGNGNRLGSGVAQMPTLKPGTYLLALHAPTGSAPVSARPALAGVELPSTAPPEEVVRGYLKLAIAPEPTPAVAGNED